MKKYELLTSDVLTLECDTPLYRIKALKDLHHPTVGLIALEGELGGYVYGEDALSHEGSAWVAEQGQVIGGRVEENGLVGFYAQVFGGLIKGNALVTGCSIVTDQATVMDNAQVKGEARITGQSVIKGNSIISGNAMTEDNALVVDGVLSQKAVASVNSTIQGAAITGDYLVQNERVYGINKGYVIYRIRCKIIQLDANIASNGKNNCSQL